MRKVDITGQRFGKLTAIKENCKKDNSCLWECLCDCGNTKVARKDSLTQGRTKSCGCLERGKTRTIDMTGQRFGKLTVIKKNKDNSYLWECLCDCGNTKVARRNNLTQGHTKSCGCLENPGSTIDMTGQRFGKLTVIGYAKGRSKIFRECLCDCGNSKIVLGGRLNAGDTKSCGCLRKDSRYKIEINSEESLDKLCQQWGLKPEDKILLLLTEVKKLSVTEVATIQNCTKQNINAKKRRIFNKINQIEIVKIQSSTKKRIYSRTSRKKKIHSRKKVTFDKINPQDCYAYDNDANEEDWIDSFGSETIQLPARSLR